MGNCLSSRSLEEAANVLPSQDDWTASSSPLPPQDGNITLTQPAQLMAFIEPAAVEQGRQAQILSPDMSSSAVVGNTREAPLPSLRVLQNAQNFVLHNLIYNEAPRPLSNNGPTAQEIAEWLKSPSYADIYKKALDEQMPGTGQWFLDLNEFSEFLNGSVRILWGMGLAGSGKTILSGISTRKLKAACSRTPDVVVAYAFLRYSEHHSAKDILGSLLEQIASAHDGALRCLAPYFRQCKKERQTEVTEREIVGMLRCAVQHLACLFIVIDGLDEASDTVKDTLLEILPQLERTRLLIMSRPLNHLLEAVPNATPVSIQALTEDIDLFVRVCIRKSSRLRGILRGEESLIEEICTKLKQQCEGMFLVARLQMEVLQNRPTNLRQLRDLLEALPPGLDKTYRDTLKRISDTSPEDASLARRTLLWTAFSSLSRRRLSAKALQHALSISFEDATFDADETIPVERIVASCAGLVEFRFGSLRFIHYTALKYLLKHSDYFEVLCPHEFISVSCIVYLNWHKSQIQLYGGDESFELNHEAVEQLCSEGTESPLFEYAYKEWGFHSSEAYKSRGETHPYTRQFLECVSSYPVKNFRCFDLACGFHLATQYGLLDVVSSIQCPLPVTPKARWTPFHFAAYSGRSDSVIALLSAGYPTSDLDARDQDGQTPLIRAVLSGSVNTVREILFCDAAPSSPGPSTVSRTVQIGVLSAHPTDRVSLSTPQIPLIPRPELNVNLKDTAGRAAVTHVSWVLDEDAGVEIIRLLLSHPEIDVNLPDKFGQPPLYHVSRHSTRLATAFVQLAGPRLNLHRPDEEGRTALFWACYAAIDHFDLTLSAGERADVLFAQDTWTRSEICQTAFQVMEKRGRTHYSPERKGRIAPELAFLLSQCRGSDGRLDGPSGDDVALVLFAAARHPCRSLIPLVLAWIRGLPLPYDFKCCCLHCQGTRGFEYWCGCIHCKA